MAARVALASLSGLSPKALTKAAREAGDACRRLRTSAASWLAISNSVTKGCCACTASEEARPSRKKPPVGVPPSRKNGGVSEAYISEGALRNPGRSILRPPRGTGSPWSVAGLAVKARLGTWQVLQDCCPE